MARTAFILLLLAGCSKQSASVGTMLLSGLDGLSGADANLVREVVQGFNDRCKKTLILSEGQSYPVTFRKTTAEEMAALPQNETAHDGLAVRAPEGCTVYIRDTIFTNTQKDSFTAVAWHELGHCYTLQHDAADTEIMYPSFQPISAYSSEAVLRFFRLVVTASGL